ncbi:MAG: FecR domain-containing protein [Anaerolineales bacterium]
MAVTSLIVSGCGSEATLSPTPEANNPRAATLSDLAGNVSGRATRADPLAPINLGFQLNTGGQVQTGDESRARLDFTDQSILRLASNSAYTLDEVDTQADGSVVARLQLTFGKLWVSVTGGAVEVETPVGVASVRGSFAVFQYAPGDPDDPTDDLLLIDCLEGSCTAQNSNVNEQLGNLERLVLNSQSSLRQTLTRDDVLLFLLDNPEGNRLVATLTAAPPATATSTSATKTLVSPTATHTATSSPAPTATGTSTPTVFIPVSGATSTVVPVPLTPAFRILGTHRVQARETLFCIGRGYGVLPAAIALANNRSLNAPLTLGERLSIPAIQWDGIPNGPVCPPQFNSPFPGLPISAATRTSTSTATLTPSATLTFQPGASTNTPVPLTSTPLPATPTFTLVPPTVTFTPSPTSTATPSPTPRGPSLSNFNGIFEAYQTCLALFAVDVVDAAGVSGARVDWVTFDAQGLATGNSGATSLIPPRAGDTWTGGTTYLDTPFVPPYGYMQWSVVATNTLNSVTQMSAPSPISETFGIPFC